MSPAYAWLCLVFLQRLRTRVCGFIFIDEHLDSLVWIAVAISFINTKLMTSILQSSIFLGCKAWVHVLRVACLWLQSNYWPVGGFLFLSLVPVAGEVARGMECTRWPGPALEPPTHTLGTGMGVGLSQVQSRCAKVRRKEGGCQAASTAAEHHTEGGCARPRILCSPGWTNATGSIWRERGVSVFVSSVKLIFAFLSRVQVAHDPVTNTDGKAWARTALRPPRPLQRGEQEQAISPQHRGSWPVVLTRSR